MTAKRPLGLSLIALLFLSEALLALGLAAFLLLTPRGGASVGTLFERLEISAAFIGLLAVPPLLTAGMAGLTFRGLWFQREWARLAALVFSLLSVLAAIAFVGFWTAFEFNQVMALYGAGAILVLAALAFFYLLRVRLAPVVAIKTGAGAPPAVSNSAATYVERQPATSPPPARRAEVREKTTGWVPPPPRSPLIAPDYHDAPTVASQPEGKTQRLDKPPIPAIAPEEPAAWLVVRQGPEAGRRYELYVDEQVFLGRDAARCEVVLNDPTVSGHHARIRYESGGFVLYDLDSTNGTLVSGHPIQRHPLEDGDEMRLGNSTLLFTTEP